MSATSPLLINMALSLHEKSLFDQNYFQKTHTQHSRQMQHGLNMILPIFGIICNEFIKAISV